MIETEAATVAREKVDMLVTELMLETSAKRGCDPDNGDNIKGREVEMKNRIKKILCDLHNRFAGKMNDVSLLD